MVGTGSPTVGGTNLGEGRVADNTKRVVVRVVVGVVRRDDQLDDSFAMLPPLRQ